MIKLLRFKSWIRRHSHVIQDKGITNILSVCKPGGHYIVLRRRDFCYVCSFVLHHSVVRGKHLRKVSEISTNNDLRSLLLHQKLSFQQLSTHDVRKLRISIKAHPVEHEQPYIHRNTSSCPTKSGRPISFPTKYPSCAKTWKNPTSVGAIGGLRD